MTDELKQRIINAIENSCSTLFHSSDLQNSHLRVFMQEIEDAHRYPLRGRGKLIRPLLILLAAGSFGGESAVAKALSAAVAVELVHTYSLVHDDLPCMDNDSMRRGQPSTHVVYGEAKGLLIGDGLLTAAFELLANPNNNLNLDSHSNTNVQNNAYLHLKLIQCLSKAIGSRGMVLGQWLDMTVSSQIFSMPDHEIQSDTDVSTMQDWELFRTIHTNKTGKLFGACFEMGYICACYINEQRELLKRTVQEHQEDRNAMFQIGLEFGFVFQIADDILDASHSSAELGKTAGKDAEQNKMTAVKILGVDGARKYARESLRVTSQKLEQFYTLHAHQKRHANSEEYFKIILNLMNLFK